MSLTRLPLLSILCLFTLASGCADGKGSASTEAASAFPYGTPDRVLQAHGEPIPVYNEFEDVAELFQHENDTTYVINFWATWCKPCVEEMPYFEQLHQQFPDEKMKVVLVSLDFEQALDTKLVPFLEERNLRSDVLVLLDGNYNEWIDQVSEAWSGAIPVTLVYNADGRKVHNNRFASYDELETMVREIL